MKSERYSNEGAIDGPSISAKKGRRGIRIYRKGESKSKKEKEIWGNASPSRKEDFTPKKREL